MEEDTLSKVFTTFLKESFKNQPRVKISELEEIDQSDFWVVPEPPNIGRTVYVDGNKFIDYWPQLGKKKLYVRFPNGISDNEMEQFTIIAGTPFEGSKSKTAWTIEEKNRNEKIRKVGKAVEQAIYNQLKLLKPRF